MRAFALAKQRGLTLLEMLIVLTLIATLLGVGVGVFGQLTLGKQAAPGLVKNVLRSARSFALLEGAPARVAIDAKNRSLRSFGLRTIGLWHLESDEMEGAFRHNGILHGGEIVPEGRIGQGVRFSGKGDGWIELPVGTLSSFQTPEGIAVEFDLLLDRPQSATLVERKNSFSLQCTADGKLRALISLEGTAMEGGGSNQAQTREGALPWGRWTRVGLLYDRKRLRIVIDGIEEVAVEERGALRCPPEPVIFGSPTSRLEAKLDEIRISAVVAGEEAVLPKEVELLPGPSEVQFDAAGNLDPSVHAVPAVLTLQLDGGKKIPIEVGIYGTIR